MFITGYTDSEGTSMAYEPLGMFVSPCGNKFSSMGYTKQEKAMVRDERRFLYSRKKIIEHLERTGRTILQELELVTNNKSTLPRHCKNLLLESQT